MLPLLVNTTLPWAPSTWRVWVDHIMKQRKIFSLKKAAIVRYGGGTASATPGFAISDAEVGRLRLAFDQTKQVESIRVSGKTYVIKSKDERQIVGFNGSKYIIVCRSKALMTVVKCESKDASDDAAKWLKRVNVRLMEKGF